MNNNGLNFNCESDLVFCLLSCINDVNASFSTLLDLYEEQMNKFDIKPRYFKLNVEYLKMEYKSPTYEISYQSFELKKEMIAAYREYKKSNKKICELILK